MNGGEFLQGLDVPEFRHRPFPSSERLMRVFSPVVQQLSDDLVAGVADYHHRRFV